MAATTDYDYNENSREIQMRYDIYFNPGGDPLVVTRDNYLISSSGTEESQSETDTALGAVSSNEITIDLLNEDRLFTPTNPDSPYYRRIKKDVRIDVFGRAVQNDPDASWDALGTYYVKDWYTSSSSVIASITAYDKMYNVLNAPTSTYKVTKDKQARVLFREFFDGFNVQANVDSSIDVKLLFAYINGANRDFITALTNGTLAMCFGNRSGGVTVLNRLTRRSLRATLKDDDQLISIGTKQSIDVGYDGASVVCNAPYEGAALEVVTLREQSIPVGTSTISSLDLAGTPLIRVLYATTTNAGVKVKRVAATPYKCELTIENTLDHSVYVDISLFGTKVETTSSTIADSGNNLLDLNSPYVQTLTQAQTCKAYLKKFVDNPAPVLTVSTRGNFKLQVGDKVRVLSEVYHTDFTGIIIRIEYKYDGSLSGTLTLMDASLFGG